MEKFNEAEYLKQEAAIKDLRAEIESISDDDLLLFADWLANNELQTVKGFIEAKAYDESREDESF